LPPGEAAQSASAVHQQVCAELQLDPAGLAAQSAFVTQPTHRPVAVSHADPDVLPAQSELLVQAFEHLAPTSGPSLRHTWPPAQSAFVLQPHVEDPPRIEALHCLPPAALAQSAIVEQPHVCGIQGGTASLGVQTGPSALVAQSAFELHATQAPVATSHTGPVALAEQSELLLQRFSHRALFEKGDPCVGQTDPAGQLLVAVHPHLFSSVPAVALANWHTLPEREDAQSEAALHPHACVSVLQRAPSALFAQSALVLQPAEASPVVASVPPSPGVVAEASGKSSIGSRAPSSPVQPAVTDARRPAPSHFLITRRPGVGDPTSLTSRLGIPSIVRFAPRCIWKGRDGSTNL
jgi:hypothetical protein